MKEEEERMKLSNWLDKIEMPEELRILHKEHINFNKKSHEGSKTLHLFDEVYMTHPQFYLQSGELALTTIGIIEHCYKTMWKFPKGCFKLEIGKKGKYDVAVITFKETFKDTIELVIPFIKTHPKDKTPSAPFSPLIKGYGSQLQVLDNEIWKQENTSIYADGYDAFAKFLKKSEMLYPGLKIIFSVKDESLITLPIKDVNMGNIIFDANTTHEYKAFAGFDQDGAILYLSIQCYSDNYRVETTFNLK